MNLDSLLFDGERGTYQFLKKGQFPHLEMATLPIAMPKVLRIFDISASNLKNADRLGTSDPYCKVIVDGREIGRTDVIMNNLNPKWTAAFEIRLFDVRCSSLSLEVYDKDFLSEDDFLGKIVVSPDALSDVLAEVNASDVPLEHSMPLTSTNKGKMKFWMSAVSNPNTTNEQAAPPPAVTHLPLPAWSSGTTTPTTHAAVRDIDTKATAPLTETTSVRKKGKGQRKHNIAAVDTRGPPKHLVTEFSLRMT